MTHVDLFSGIGGFALAARWAGLETVLFCEKEDYAQKVLKRHWPHVPIVDDIRELTYERYIRLLGDSAGIRRQGVFETEPDRQGRVQESEAGSYERYVADANGSAPRPFLLTGGFPCQPFSHAGKREGTSDDRYLWPEMVRVIDELHPRWVIGENVAGILSMDDGRVMEQILADLGSVGYRAEVYIIPAAAVGAPHRRDRVWIVGHANAERRQERHPAAESNREKAASWGM